MLVTQGASPARGIKLAAIMARLWERMRDQAGHAPRVELEAGRFPDGRRVPVRSSGRVMLASAIPPASPGRLLLRARMISLQEELDWQCYRHLRPDRLRRQPRMMGDAFSAVRLHADHGDVTEEVPALVPGLDAFRPASRGYAGTSGVGDLVADVGVLALAATVAPSRIVIGGGVLSQPRVFMHGLRLRLEGLRRLLGHAMLAHFIVPPVFGQQAGIRGALLFVASGSGSFRRTPVISPAISLVY